MLLHFLLPHTPTHTHIIIHTRTVFQEEGGSDETDATARLDHADGENVFIPGQVNNTDLSDSLPREKTSTGDCTCTNSGLTSGDVEGRSAGGGMKSCNGSHDDVLKKCDTTVLLEDGGIEVIAAQTLPSDIENSCKEDSHNQTESNGDALYVM